MKVYSVFLSFFAVIQFGLGQKSNDKDFYSVPFTVYKTQSDTISFQDMEALVFKPKSKFNRSTPKDIYWAKMDFREYSSLLSSNPWVLQTGYLTKAKLYFKDKDSIKTKILGSFELNNKYTGDFRFTQDNLINGRYLYLKFSMESLELHIDQKEFWFFSPDFQKKQRNYVTKGKSMVDNLIHFFLGASLIAVIMSFIFLRVHKRWEYLFYALYIIGLMFSLGKITSTYYDQYIGLFSLTDFILEMVLDLLTTIFYLLFVRHYLNTEIKYPLLDRVIKIYATILAVLIPLNTGILSLKYFEIHFILGEIKMYGLVILEIFAIVYLLPKWRKDKYTRFVLIGTLIFGIGSILVEVLSNFYYLKAAAFAEIFVFFLALGYKIQQEEKIKKQVQQTAIENYKSLLRSQINPHFIFNALNSIQNLIVSDNRTSALNYLGKFSKLLRTNLESSIEHVLTLDEEINFLETYLELEALRFDDAFEYTVEVETNISPEEIMIPQLMIQPFVENALLHGLLPKKDGNKVLVVSFKIDDDFLICTIDDNGVGRQATKRIKQNNDQRKSRGMEVTQKRINALYADEKEKNRLNIKDKVDEKGNALGTKVTIKIPLVS